MGRKSGNEGEFKAQSYFRLLRYARPYWFRLTVGIVSGILVGGSLLVSLLMIPRLVGAVEPGAGGDTAAFEAEARNVVQVLEKPELTRAEKEKAVQELLHPVDNDPQLTKILNEARRAAEKYGLPFSVEGREIVVSWPVSFRFEAIGPGGRLAWQIFAVYVLVFVLAWTVKNLATFISNYYTRWVGAKVVSDLRDKVFDKLVNQSLQYYGKIDIGHLISRSTNDTSAIENAVSNSVADLTSAPIQIFACLVAILMACREYDSYSCPRFSCRSTSSAARSGGFTRRASPASRRCFRACTRFSPESGWSRRTTPKKRKVRGFTTKTAVTSSRWSGRCGCSCCSRPQWRLWR